MHTGSFIPEKSKFWEIRRQRPRGRKGQLQSAPPDVLEQQFREEADMGFMEQVPIEVARKEYGPKLRIAAQGAIFKGNSSWRVSE